jgi:hypothetical protein
MNGVKLLELALAVAPLMPSEGAAPKAPWEWRLARQRWLEALAALNLDEGQARDLSARQRTLREMPETFS